MVVAVSAFRAWPAILLDERKERLARLCQHLLLLLSLTIILLLLFDAISAGLPKLFHQ